MLNEDERGTRERDDYYKRLVQEILREPTTDLITKDYVKKARETGSSWKGIYHALRMFQRA